MILVSEGNCLAKNVLSFVFQQKLLCYYYYFFTKNKMCSLFLAAIALLKNIISGSAYLKTKSASWEPSPHSWAIFCALNSITYSVSRFQVHKLEHLLKKCYPKILALYIYERTYILAAIEKVSQPPSEKSFLLPSDINFTPM